MKPELPEARPIDTRQVLHPSPLIFDQGAPGRRGASLPALDVPAVDPHAAFGALARKAPTLLPEVSEVEVTRHFTRPPAGTTPSTSASTRSGRAR
jgi:hypothetical protein